jgi:hypothetical protein
VRSTPTAQEFRMVCTGQTPGTGVMKINAPTPESMNATFEMSVGQGERTMQVHSQMKGRWLRADCGELQD